MSDWLSVLVVVESLAVLGWIAWLATRQTKLVFLFGFNVMLPVACLHLMAGGHFDWRTGLAALSMAIYLADMAVVGLLWSGNTAMGKLDAHLSTLEKNVLPFVMANVAGWIYCLPFLFIGQRTGPFDAWDGAGLGLYALGTLIHFLADWQKKRFKDKPESQGRVFDGGLWRFSRHPNYLGDILVYAGWAAMAANPWAFVSPAANLLQYLFDAIPKNERWARERYGQAWLEYAARTSRLVPLL